MRVRPLRNPGPNVPPSNIPSNLVADSYSICTSHLFRVLTSSGSVFSDMKLQNVSIHPCWWKERSHNAFSKNSKSSLFLYEISHGLAFLWNFQLRFVSLAFKRLAISSISAYNIWNISLTWNWSTSYFDQVNKHLFRHYSAGIIFSMSSTILTGRANGISEMAQTQGKKGESRIEWRNGTSTDEGHHYLVEWQLMVGL